MPNEVHVGDIGTVFSATVKEDGVALDISPAVVKNFTFGRPDGSSFTRNSVFTTTGLDGKMQYATIVGDLDQEGAWRVQGYVELPNGKWHTSISTFSVAANI